MGSVDIKQAYNVIMEYTDLLTNEEIDKLGSRLDQLVWDKFYMDLELDKNFEEDDKKDEK